MTGTITHLAIAIGLFVGSHVLISSTALRPMLIAALGPGTYRGLYSLLQIVLLVWVVFAFRDAPPGPPLWWTGSFGAAVAVVLMPLALLLVVGGLSQPNPNAVGGERLLEDGVPARGALRITRNPMLWGLALWGLAHLAGNVDLRRLLLFGGLTLLAAAGTWLIDMKQRRLHAAQFAPYELVTSNLPFVAILQGRNSLGAAVREIGWLRLLAAVVLYGALLHGHAWLFGAAPLAWF